MVVLLLLLLLLLLFSRGVWCEMGVCVCVALDLNTRCCIIFLRL